MKRKIVFTFIIVFLLALTGCNNRSMNSIIQNEPNIIGIVKTITNDAFLMENETGEFWVSLKVENKDSMTNFSVGDEVVVYFDGNVAESCPMQINTVYAITLKTPAGASLTLNDVIILSQKGYNLTWTDFEKYDYVETGSGLYIRVYEINDIFQLWIGGSHPIGYPDSDPMYIYLTLAEDKDTKIDIRDGDVAAFISEHKDGADELGDRVPMVMIDGTLYLDTGRESSVMARCGMMDGEITSQVAGSEVPAIDDQSNFGTGYRYQYGTMEGTIDIYMNGKWWIFATEEAGKRILFPHDAVEEQQTDMESPSHNNIDRTLTQEEIDRVNETFSPILFDKQGNPIATNIWTCFFTSYYEDIRDMDFAEFLMYYPGDGSTVDGAEFDILKNQEDFLFKGVEALEDMPVPVHKHPARIIDLTLKEYAGITLSDLDTSKVNYLSAYDAFYNYTSDYAPGTFLCTRGEIAGNLVRLYEDSEHGADVLTLQKDGDRYLIAAHQQFVH